MIKTEQNINFHYFKKKTEETITLNTVCYLIL